MGARRAPPSIFVQSTQMLKRIHLPFQWLFLRVEALFNLAFGERLNPLYYLGPIAYYLMWLVVGSGLYLYAFFKTGVAEAHASVEYLSVQQWYLGGVMRSLHRYGSDGVALTMLLHMARHWSASTATAVSAGSPG
jgi:CDP-4-dehydro-6-deoxyglucose reductase